MASDNANGMKSAAREEFDAWAETYDRSPLHRFLFEPTYAALLEALVRWRGPEVGSLRSLDVGCGTGTLVRRLAGSGPDVRATGLDYATAMVRVAHEKAAQAGVAGACTFTPGDAEHLPFVAESFDLVTCSHSFHHYPHQQEAILEMRRVLRPGGRLMIADGFRDNAVGWFVFDVCITAVEKEVYHVPWTGVRTMFQQAGFRDVQHHKVAWLFPTLLTVGTA